MSLKDAILEIPELVKQLKAKFNTQKFAEVKLEDGTIIQYEGDTPVVGIPVNVIAVDGTVAPLVDGDYDLAELGIIKVVGGMIAEIKPVEAKGDVPATEEQMSEPQTQSVKRIVESVIKESQFISQKDFTDFKEAFEKTSIEQIEALTKENESLKKELGKQADILKETFALVEKISEMESEKSKIDKKDGFRKEKKESSTSEEINEFRKKYLNQ